jgi:archaellum component FlaC
MTIDERLDRLVERHEALTQTVEHLASQGEEQNKRIRLQGENIDKILENIGKILTAFEKDGENIRALARIAEIHEHRISDLEDDRG